MKRLRDTSFRQLAWYLSLLIVAAVSALNISGSLERSIPSPSGLIKPPLEAVAEVDERFAELRKDLSIIHPPDVIGYIGDPTVAASKTTSEVQEYYQAQFAMIPVVLDQNFEAYNWAVANLRKGKLDQQLLMDWEIHTRYENGVLLLKRKAPR